jgi:hypothetical protein
MYDFEKLNSKQEIYNYVCEKLWKQGERSMIKNPAYNKKNILTGEQFICAYRGDGGRKCAIGFLIPDNFYNPRMETKSFMSLIDYIHKIYPINDTKYENFILFLENNEIFLNSIQFNLHDTLYNFKNNFKIVATEFAGKNNLVPYAFSD